MPMTRHFHPLSSFCSRALVGLCELDAPFDKHLVDLRRRRARRVRLKNARAYLARLKERASVARVLDEARPYLHPFPA